MDDQDKSTIDVEKIIREYLPEVIHLSLATIKDNTPWVCELHFAYDNDLNLYFRSLTSRRHSQEIAANPKVAGNIIKQHSPEDSAVGVYFEGTAKLLKERDEEELTMAFLSISKRFNLDRAILDDAKHEDGHQFYKISVENYYVFGRFGLPSGQKYKLVWSGGKK